MLLQLLGPVEARTADGRVIHLRPRELEVLGYLLLHAGTACSTDMLLQDVWGDDQPDDPGTTLRGTISRIRRALRHERLIVTVGHGLYRADPPPGSLDKHRFEALLAEAAHAADQGQPEEEVGLLHKAMACWPHPEIGFPGMPDSLRVREKTEHLLEQRRTAQLRLADLHLKLGHHDGALPFLHAHYAADPSSERRCAQLMRALIASGRKTEALDAYQQCRQVLHDEYGASPGEELQALLIIALGGAS